MWDQEINQDGDKKASKEEIAIVDYGFRLVSGLKSHESRPGNAF